MQDPIDSALRIMMSLAGLPALEPALVSRLLGGVRWQVIRQSPARIDHEAVGPFPFPAEKVEHPARVPAR